MQIWQTLYRAAKSVQKERTISPFLTAGQVAAALVTKKGAIYTGVCLDSSSALGMCAERNAIAHMLTSGEYEIEKILAVGENGELLLPCGACRELMMQLSPQSGEIEILTDFQTLSSVRLKELIPFWWGEKYFQ